MTTRKKELKERRIHPRHPVKAGTITTNNQTGEIIDISMGGLAFSYVDRGDWQGESFDRGMLLGERDLCIEDVPLKIISDCAINSGLSIIRRCGVQFGKLTPKQMAQLEYFIWANTGDREDGEEGKGEETE
ncbi:MAG TPA: PilZ domain-containing protein [Desulfurivibrionaceae bacterium]|nr:PilZ domain-containing protein [Desulfurivibrionaceae bacterium]